MHMARLPSYGEAISGGHWLDLVAPYVAVCDYARACRVSCVFYNQFAPRLWNDPLQTFRLLGLLPHQVRAATRQLVTSLDFRGFVSGCSALIDYQGFSKTLQLFRIRFPAIRCIVLDGLVDYNPAELLRPRNVADFCPDGSVPLPLVLSLGHCSLPLPNNFFLEGYWRQLVYLDVSDIPGSLHGLTSNASIHIVLPNLRILKVRGREMKDESLMSVLHSFGDCLWSVDLSRNSLTDAAVRLLASRFLSRPTVQTDAYFATEGKISVIKDAEGKVVRSNSFGDFIYISESSWSSAFSHPERHLADSPAYDPNAQWRLGGHECLRVDNVEDAKTSMAGGVGKPIPDWNDVQATENGRGPGVLTHLHLGGNANFTVKGVSQLFRQANGHLRHFDCEAPSIFTSVKTQTRLSGALGCSHLFRPVMASNLQSLRIHHSLVTQAPTVRDPSMSAMECVLFAETVLRERAEIAFPIAFIPDLNPRLQSLTLTCLPRISTGPLIDRLIRFLQLAAEQEKAIQSTVDTNSRRSPTMLRGLRHIRLEFGATPSDNETNGLEDLDTGALLRLSKDDFSFFGEGGWDLERNHVRADADDRRAKRIAERSGSPISIKIESDDASQTKQPVRLAHYPLPATVDVDGTHEHVRATVQWEDKAVGVYVWVGTGILGVDHAVNAYMSNLANHSLQTDIGPATPDQTAAGVPSGVCVFNAAWDAILFTEVKKDPLGRAPSQELRDVVQAIRQFRIGTRAAYAARRRIRGSSDEGGNLAKVPLVQDHWSGNLEILLGG
ncbi:leucine rich repeat domain containing protein [Grosmannia clavigera kw1407]|uniref:Leucine rich repeat domain containing protein n=1 Tax=Grosmannia clavigera (strain kw1407 / UAMH 11150) TaxID=655863 RepID=F0X708_GROCL|nr:leucine rich repeat domain containing protein [Grosmannia clavigera kw1407]EFX06446.1 leucine rich repeat domain containing protein [Grosmannia clavigera kw1407]